MKYYSEDGQYSIEVAILKDLNEWAEGVLKNGGFTDIEPSKALRQYCEMKLRILQAKPRKIERSREFLCPAGFELGLNELEKAIEQGLPLDPYMSKNIRNASYQDKFINDWGMYHFHLGTGFDNNDPRFIARTGHLLVAFVDLRNDDTVYFLQIVPHRKSIWTQQGLIRILADNWPDKVSMFDGVARLTVDITDEGYRELRDANVMTAIDLKDGRVVFPPNLGLTTAGTSIRAGMSYNRKCNDAITMEKNISQSVEFLCDVINHQRYEPANSFVLHLIQPGLSDYTFRVDDENYFIRIFYHNKRLAAIVGDNQKEIDDNYREHFQNT